MKSLVCTTAVVCSALCLPVCSLTLAATRYVDGSVSASGDGTSWETAFQTIQEGIDAASDGDSVIVAEWIYVENIRFNGKNITLTSTDPLDSTVVANTIIDGNQAGSVITFSGTETEFCILSGFTLRNGGAEYGGGVHGAKTHATLRNNVIIGNLAQNVGGGLWDCSGRIQNNVIARNRAGDSGGGQAYCGGIIENNTVVDNWAEHESGGAYKCGDMENCIIWGNEGRDVFLGCTGPSYSCIQGWYYSGGGNIRHFPYFVDAPNCDYRLKSYSPCVDAGNPSSEFGMEPEPSGERIDMGAYGNTPQATPASLDTDVDLLPDDWEIAVFGNLAQGTSDDWDGDWRSSLEEYHQGTNPASLQRLFVNSSVAVSGDGGSWETAFKTIQEALDVTPQGYTICVAEGVYEENICFHGKNVTLRSKDPLGSNTVSKTVIDGGGHDSVVAFSGTEDETCVLAGFTIRNGRATEGGGIRGGVSTKWTHATIRNNVITGNAATRDGGGLAYCLGVIQNNIVSGNSAGEDGGGLCDCTPWLMENNTVYGNSAAYGGGGLCRCRSKLINCIVWGNAPSQLYDCDEWVYSCIQNERQPDTGNIWFYPHFADPEGGDYHLLSWSPCIDSGDPSSDFSREPYPNGGRINIGAYGNTPEATPTLRDTDKDLLPDDWEMHFFGDLSQGASDDWDGEGRSNLQEYRHGTDPTWFATWYVDRAVPVPGDGTSWERAFRTVQDGIDRASEGDTVLVAEGIYSENIHFGGENITLRSTDPFNPAIVAGTIIDGGQRDSVVTFHGTEDETCLLSGFTIQNGGARFGAGIAGGQSPKWTLSTIQNNVIKENRAESYGGGVWCCAGTITSNVICSNSAGFGGGLVGCNGTITNNIICHNWAVEDGGGLYRCNGTVENNTILGNAARWGAGLLECSGEVRNCIIWDNLSPYRSQVCNSYTIRYCCIQHWRTRDSNIWFYPHFADPEGGDYHLLSWSPCIDSGDPSSDFSREPYPNGGRINIGAYGNTPEATPTLRDTDKDLLPDDWEIHFFGDLSQGASDDWDGEGRSNLQEYRHGTDPTWFATWYVDRAVPVPGDGTSWERAFRTVQDGIDRASEGDTVLVAEGMYSENIHFGGENITLRSTDPFNPAVVAGTIIDGGQRDSVVTFHGTEDETCLLSGFTIRNGTRGGSGGGVGGHETRAVIENNVIAANSGPGLCDCEGTIQRNVIGGNLGCGLYSCDGLILNNLIVANSEASMGGGLYWCKGPIRNNTIFGNSAGHFGGLYGCSGPIKNCIISGNTAEDGEQIGLSGSPVYCCVPGLSAGGQGNIAGDPRFVDTENGDFRLRADSPCIDAGLNSPDLAEFDIAGMHRVMFGGKSLTVDMGAYEFHINKLEPIPGTDEAILTWSSLADKTYSIFYTDNLFDWHTAIDNFPSLGNQITSWTDDGFLTGIPPLLAPKRFYRILENP